MSLAEVIGFVYNCKLSEPTRINPILLENLTVAESLKLRIITIDKSYDNLAESHLNLIVNNN